MAKETAKSVGIGKKASVSKKDTKVSHKEVKKDTTPPWETKKEDGDVKVKVEVTKAPKLPPKPAHAKPKPKHVDPKPDQSATKLSRAKVLAAAAMKQMDPLEEVEEEVEVEVPRPAPRAETVSTLLDKAICRRPVPQKKAPQQVEAGKLSLDDALRAQAVSQGQNAAPLFDVSKYLKN